MTKQEEISDELASLKISDFRREGKNDKEAVTELIDRVAALTLLALPSGRSDSMQKRLLRSAVSGTQWGLHAERSGSISESFHQYIDTLFASFRTLERMSEDKKQDG